MDRLEAAYGDEIQFILLNVDDPATLPLREQFNIVPRTRYVLVDPDGETVQFWIGPLSITTIDDDIGAWLAAQ
ncbi:MAG: hypothetical protein AAF787_19090 [Chloroflexota bacterium]